MLRKITGTGAVSLSSTHRLLLSGSESNEQRLSYLLPHDVSFLSPQRSLGYAGMAEVMTAGTISVQNS